MSNKTAKIEIAMLGAVVVAAAVSAIRPLGLVRNPYDRIGTVLAWCEAKINSNNGVSRSAMFSAPFPHRHARAALEEALEVDVGFPPAEIGDGRDGL